MSKSIKLEINNPENIEISKIDMGSVRRGHQTLTHIFRIKNLGKAVDGVYIKSAEGLYQVGSNFETYLSCFLSVDNEYYNNQIEFNLDEGEVKEIYIKWSPVDSSRANTHVEWDLILGVYNENVEILCT